MLPCHLQNNISAQCEIFWISHFEMVYFICGLSWAVLLTLLTDTSRTLSPIWTTWPRWDACWRWLLSFLWASMASMSIDHSSLWCAR